MTTTPDWFDAHLDLASMVEWGRDVHAPLAECRGRHQPASITLPTLADGGVRACLGTIFTEPIADPSAPDAETGPNTYPTGDAEAARRAGLRQLKLYQSWARAGVIAPLARRGEEHCASDAPLRLGVLMEGADPILSPDDLDEWLAPDDSGVAVVAVGMAWWPASRYAGGNASDNADLTDLGRALVPALDASNIVHDLSHLSQRSADELLALTDRPVIASHSNCRALLPGENHRHLADETIAEIGRRGGVVGINLVRNFLAPELAASENQTMGEATVGQAADHIEHIARAMGRRDGVALGSDMDGGISANDLPAGIDTPSDLTKITDELAARGWSESELHAFRWATWAGFWGL